MVRLPRDLGRPIHQFAVNTSTHQILQDLRRPGGAIAVDNAVHCRPCLHRPLESLLGEELNSWLFLLGIQQLLQVLAQFWRQHPVTNLVVDGAVNELQHFLVVNNIHNAFDGGAEFTRDLGRILRLLQPLSQAFR